jgi:putative transcriptional regulator
MISEEVRELRDSMGMNRREFCEYFSIPYRTMSDWEAGKRKMPEYLLRLMEYKAKTEKLVETN